MTCPLSDQVDPIWVDTGFLPPTTLMYTQRLIVEDDQLTNLSRSASPTPSPNYRLRITKRKFASTTRKDVYGEGARRLCLQETVRANVTP